MVGPHFNLNIKLLTIKPDTYSVKVHVQQIIIFDDKNLPVLQKN